MSATPPPDRNSALRPDLLKGRFVLVTGGGTGLGRAMGERFMALGARLMICGRRDGRGARARGALPSDGSA